VASGKTLAQQDQSRSLCFSKFISQYSSLVHIAMTGIFPVVNAPDAKVTERVQLMMRLKWKGMNWQS
jgi:hypothetical protein